MTMSGYERENRNVLRRCLIEKQLATEADFRIESRRRNWLSHTVETMFHWLLIPALQQDSDDSGTLTPLKLRADLSSFGRMPSKNMAQVGKC